MTSRYTRRPRPALDQEALERLALAYVGRYATTRSKLRSYLRRKLQERGWDGEGSAPVEQLIERFAVLGYVDDAAFASARAASLQRRGYGERRVAQALAAAGVGEDEAQAARELARESAMEAALRFARRKRIGPFAESKSGLEARQKAFAAMVRAGHPIEIVRQVVDAEPGEMPQPPTLRK